MTSFVSICATWLRNFKHVGKKWYKHSKSRKCFTLFLEVKGIREKIVFTIEPVVS